eukprot:TRINITY_DN11935_c0_g1_i1.p1 TRINITY_DN11935_c0_g1~~TRINITY_DN11935_c0_g1_i1.p1  ORF type:complete len:104 (+),score=8.56 TRINITY_DN11935_c0_g1_i1:358-669(+)
MVWAYPMQALIKIKLKCVRIACGGTSRFPMTIDLHLGLALIPYLFTLIMDELIAHIQEEIPWFMLFAYDIMLVDEVRDSANVKLERWREAFESKGFKISCTKT